jgi:hypothetical protein
VVVVVGFPKVLRPLFFLVNKLFRLADVSSWARTATISIRMTKAFSDLLKRSGKQKLSHAFTHI